MRYDPEKGPRAEDWLQLDETERNMLVEDYHHRKWLNAPNPQLHALVHTIVENQLAEKETIVVEALARLRKEGLTRHEAIHAIASVLIEHIHKALSDGGRNVSPDPYYERLKTLTAEEWRKM